VAWRRDKSEKKIKGEGWGEKENDNWQGGVEDRHIRTPRGTATTCTRSRLALAEEARTTTTHAREILRSSSPSIPSPGPVLRSARSRTAGLSWLHRFLGEFLRRNFKGLIWGWIGGESCDLCVVLPSILPPGPGNFFYFPSFYLRFVEIFFPQFFSS
jgi:hypothetical protein